MEGRAEFEGSFEGPASPAEDLIGERLNGSANAVTACWTFGLGSREAGVDGGFAAGVTSEVGDTTLVKDTQGIEGSVGLEVVTSFGHVAGASSSLGFECNGPRASLSFRAEALTGLRTTDPRALIPVERQGDGAALIWSK